MTENPETADTPKTGLTVTDPRNAPLIYFEGAPNFGANNGMINVTLAVNRYLLNPSGVAVDVVAAAHLRCSAPAALDLLNALQAALLLTQKPSGGAH